MSPTEAVRVSCEKRRAPLAPTSMSCALGSAVLVGTVVELVSVAPGVVVLASWARERVKRRVKGRASRGIGVSMAAFLGCCFISEMESWLGERRGVLVVT